MDKKQISKIFNETATLLELKDADFFKVRAYRRAARSLNTSDIDLSSSTNIGDLKSIEGIGKNIANHIMELISDGTFHEYEKLKSSTPPGLMDMLKIQGMGAKMVKYLFKKLGISDIEGLEQACLENKLSILPGFGEKTQNNILKGIHALKKYKNRFLFGEVVKQAENILEKVRKSKFVLRASLGGSIRRKNEVVKNIDIVASTDDPGKVIDLFTTLDEAEDVIAKGDTNSSIRLDNGINVDIWTVKDWQFPYALHYFTGSTEYNIAMRSVVKKLGFKMDEYGLLKNDTLIKCKSEEDIFKFFGMAYIPPELRENFGEIEAATRNQLPDLVTNKDIKGIIHVHTTYSDGKITLEQMTRQAIKIGFKYIGISEHSRSAWYAGGLKEEDIDTHLKEIDRLNKKFEDFKIFKGIESEILNDGSLDYDNHVLKKFDFIIIAIHSNFNMKKKDITARIIKAIENPYSTILAHPTGRLLLARDPYEVEVEDIIDAAAANGVALELNASPFRLDLDWRYAKYAKKKNVKVFINPDAHDLDALYDYRFGINIARKGWLEKNDIANTMNAQEMEEYLILKKKL